MWIIAFLGGVAFSPIARMIIARLTPKALPPVVAPIVPSYGTWEPTVLEEGAIVSPDMTELIESRGDKLKIDEILHE